MIDAVRGLLALVFLLLGSILMLIAAIGVLRMPDLLMRMQAATKASALGAGLLFFAALLYFWELQVTMRALAAIVFIFLTLPLAAHLLARASYLSGVDIAHPTQIVLPEPFEEDTADEEPSRDERPPGHAR